MKLISKYYHHPYFLYFLQLVVLITGALFFAGGCPTETYEETGPPTPPVAFMVTSLSESSLRIEWTKAGTGNIEYEVERSDAGATYTRIGIADGENPNYTDFGLDRSKMYYYRVRGIRNSEVGDYSKTITVNYSKSIQLLRVMNNDGWQSLAISTDGTYLVSYGNSNTFNIWNTSNWSLLRPDNPSEGIIGHAAFAGNTDYLVTSVGFSSPLPAQIKIWRPSDGQLIRTIVLDTAFTSVQDIAVSPDGTTLAEADYGGRLRLWDLTNGNFVQLLDTLNNTSTWDIAMSPSANILVAASFQSMKIWNLDTRQLTNTLSGPFYNPVFNQAGSGLMVNGSNGATYYRTSDWTPVYSLDTARTAVAFSPNDSLLVFGDLNVVRIARESDGSLLQSLYAHSGSILSIVFFPSGQQFATSSSDRTTKIWSLFQAEQWHIVE